MYRTAALVVLLACQIGVRAADEERVAMPAAGDVEKASKLVRDLFKDDFAKTAPKAKLALAEKLYKQAEETTDDTAAQYVLFRDTAELAAAGGDGELALRAVDRIRARFTGVPPEAVEGLFKTLTTKATTADANFALANYLIRVTDEAVAADDLDAAERLAKMADTAAVKSKHVRTAAAANGRVKEVDAFKKEAPAVKAALKKLETEPADVAASTLAGKYYAFQKGVWEKGLPLLASGDDAKLKAVAEKEVADPKEGAELMAVADGWYDVAAAAPAGPVKRGAQARAFAFYSRAVGDLMGLNKTRTEKRLDELEKVVESRGGFDELGAAMRAAVKNKEIEELRAVGGAFGDKEFKEMGPSGGVLIGFHYGIRKVFNTDCVCFLQPIYMTPTGEKAGTAFGKPTPKPLTVKAKTGYAVGAITAQAGRGVDGFSLTFMRVQGKGLNPADKYESAWAGQNTARRDGTTGDGRPIVGLLGRREAGNEDIIIHLGPIVAGPKPKKN